LKIDFPEVLLPALLAAVRRSAAVRKRNLTDAEFQKHVNNLKNNHGLPDL
jgi:hypothetical protein